MVDRESKRTCFKCGCSPAADNVKLFRFPKPAVRNLVRCELWAKYIFPERESTIDLQRKLHSEHRMLCQKHFKDEDFTDCSKKLLLKDAAPSDGNIQPLSIPTSSMEPEAGPSQRAPLVDISHIQNVASTSTSTTSTTAHPRQNVTYAPNTEPITGSSETPAEKENVTGHSIRQSMSHSEKESILFAKCSKYMRKVYQLQTRIKNLKRNAALKIISEEECVKKLAKKVTPTFALLLQSQIRNSKKKLTGRRWLKEEKITALRIYKRSPTCYRLLRRLFHLPSPSTLKSLLNKVPFNAGINKPVFEVLKNYVNCQKSSDNNYILMFDEMSIKKHLSYNNKEDVIEGYQDHAAQGRSPLVASYALVFMIAGIRKRVKQPIAHYFSSGFSTADRLAVLIKEVLYECFQAGINIAAIVCDMDGVNRRALSILGASMQNPSITVNGKEIQTLFDPPHLLKCFRNLFLKYDIECTTNISTVDNITGRGIAKWSHIKEFYEADSKNPNFVYAPALRKDHLDPNTKQKMKVKLAAQVLSHSVAGGMYSKINTGELPADAVVTASLVSDIDKLFDALNSDQPDLRRGKPYATNLTKTSPHLGHFSKMKKFFATMTYIGCSRKPPSQEGWIWTLNAIERLWINMAKTHKITSLATRRLQQDPLENLFGCIRGYCGSNTNPTTGQFVAGLKTSILNNLPRMGITGNCETDNNVVINNLDTLLSVQKLTHTEVEAEFNYVDMPDMENILKDDSAEIQACTYVCGFLVKQLPVGDCENCKQLFIASNVGAHHSFVECREYSDYKKSLNYVTKDLVNCVECCATLINIFLNEKGHVKNVKNNIVTNLKISVNFDFLSRCATHKENNMNIITNNVFYICMKRFCTLQNRKFAEQASASALKRKMDIIMHR